MSLKNKGFTLIELLVVIAIIGLLASIVLVSLNSARQKARTSRAIGDLRNLQTALEMYYDSVGSYPSSGGNWDGLYSCWGDSTSNWITGLVPAYLPQLPREPRGITDCDKQYIYYSNGTDYKLIYHNPENCSGVKTQYPSVIDPIRDCWAYGNWSSGGRNF
jgi:type II secretion system protein G